MDVKTLLRMSLPADTWVQVANVPALIKKNDPDFDYRKAGFDRLLTMLKAFPEIVKTRDDGGTPPAWSCKLSEDGMQCFKSLFKRHKDQPACEVFSHFIWDQSKGETWETPFERLAAMAGPERWHSPDDEGGRYAVLKSYLDHTFLRLLDQDRVVVAGNKACFNTGLVTREEKEIYATFYRSRGGENSSWPDWVLYGFFDSYSDRLSDFAPLPQPADYIDKTSDLVFDRTFDLEINAKHVAEENLPRFPAVFRDNPRLALTGVQGAIELLRGRIRRNYKIAQPSWHDGKIQLLLPLYLTDEDRPDLVMVAEKDEVRRIYRIKTVLTLEMAYKQLRQICAPDKPWIIG